jgi:hypothetical protein
MARKAKPIPIDDTEEDLLEDLDEIEENGEEEEGLEELEEEEETEELEEEEEEEPEPPRRKAKAARVTNPEDPKGIIRTVLVDGLLAYVDQQIDERIATALAGQGMEQRKTAVKKTTQKVAKRTAAPVAKKTAKTAGKTPATTQEVREWLQENNYDVSDRGRISEAAKKFYTKKTGRRVAS